MAEDEKGKLNEMIESYVFKHMVNKCHKYTVKFACTTHVCITEGNYFSDTFI